MSRVLLPSGTSWFDELKAVSYYGESELEREIRQHAGSLFPDFYLFPFKRDVISKVTGVSKRPDLGIIRRDLSSWAVIEVELGEHDLKHVLEQVGCFAEGEYNAPEMAEYINRQMKKHHQKTFPRTRLEALIGRESPSILVVADVENPDWIGPLKGSRADLCIFQIYKNTKGEHLYRILGGYPNVPKREVHCRRHAQLPNVLEVAGSFSFKKTRPDSQIDVVFNTTLTRWAVFVVDGIHYLRFLGKANPLPVGSTYTLFIDKRNRYHFRIT